MAAEFLQDRAHIELPIAEMNYQPTADKTTIDESSTRHQLKFVDNFLVSKSVYKYRTSRKERVFVPPTDTDTFFNTNTREDNDSSADFIAINDDTNITEVSGRYVNISKTNKIIKKGNIKSTYLPLKVKRIQGNSVRLKATKISKSQKKMLKKKTTNL